MQVLRFPEALLNRLAVYRAKHHPIFNSRARGFRIRLYACDHDLPFDFIYRDSGADGFQLLSLSALSRSVKSRVRVVKLADHLFHQGIKLIVVFDRINERAIAVAHGPPVNAVERRVEILFVNRFPNILKDLFAVMPGKLLPSLENGQRELFDSAFSCPRPGLATIARQQQNGKQRIVRMGRGG